MKVHTEAHRRSTHLALLAGQVLATLAFLGTHAFASGDEPRPWLALFTLAPPFAFWLQRFGRRFLPEAFALLLLTLPQLAPFALVPPGDAATILMAALYLLGLNLSLAADDDRACVGALFFPPVFIVIEMVLAPGPRWLALFPAAMIVTLVGANLFEARRRTRWLTERLRLRVPAPGRNDRALVLSGLGFALALLLCLPLLSLPLALLPTPTLGGSAPSTPPPGTRDELERLAQRSDERGSAPAPTGAETSPFSEELFFSGGVTRLERSEVMRVRPHVDGAVRPVRGGLYLRGMVLDTILVDRASFRGPVEPPSFAPDARGWTRVTSDATPAAFELEIRQQPLLVREGGWSLLFTPAPLLSVDRGPVLHDPDGFFLWPFPATDDWLEYRLRIAAPRPTGARALAGLDPRWTQRPDAPQAMAWIRELAREVTAGARSDRERVERVVAYFRDGFEYSLDSTELPGLAGVLDFLERRSGHCSYFAVAAALMLRSLELPTRVATGFLCSQWSEEDDGYVVTTRDGHAWLEVALEDSGWTTFEPTPADRRNQALARALAEEEGGLGTSAARALSALAAWVSTGERFHLDELAGALGELGAALLVHPLLLGLAACAVVALAWRLSPRRQAGGKPRAPAFPIEVGLYERLLHALAREGYRRSPASTPREFAAEVHAHGGDLYVPLLRITELFYRSRYGRAAWTDSERTEVLRFLGILSERSTRPS